VVGWGGKLSRAGPPRDWSRGEAVYIRLGPLAQFFLRCTPPSFSGAKARCFDSGAGGCSLFCVRGYLATPSVERAWAGFWCARLFGWVPVFSGRKGRAISPGTITKDIGPAS
jgi:hypothetical protein